VRIDVRRSAQIKKGEEIVGNRTKVKIVKNKVAPPFRTAEFDIMYNEGISAAGDILDTGVKYEVIEKKGNSYNFVEVKLGVGREAAKATLKADKKLGKEISKKIYEKLKEIESSNQG
jgi:recombination protein RecA